MSISRKIFAAKTEEKINLINVCSVCRKPIDKGRRGSLTAWIFRANNCSCDLSSSLGLASDVSIGVSRDESPKTADDHPDLDNRYEILEFLGEGGMGRVYKVNDKDIGKALVVKVLRAELAQDAQAVKRFEQEAKATAALTHPNLVPVYGSGRTKDGTPYLIMDYLEGDNLAVILKQEGRMEEKRALGILIQCVEALVHAHQKDIIHRDLKPSNILITKTDSGADLVHLVDFGIAKIQGGNVRETLDLTQTGDVFGSPEYMSPEQSIGIGVKPQSDIYSFGCVMYECLSGNPPFSGDNPIQIIAKHLNEAPKRLNKSIVSNNLQSIILTCLQKDTKHRYDSEELLEELRRVQSGARPLISAPDITMPAFTPKHTFILCMFSVSLTAILFELAAKIKFGGDELFIIVAVIFLVFFGTSLVSPQWKKVSNKFEREPTAFTLLPVITFWLYLSTPLLLWVPTAFARSLPDAIGLAFLVCLPALTGLALSLFAFSYSRIEQRFKTAPVLRTVIYVVLILFTITTVTIGTWFLCRWLLFSFVSSNLGPILKIVLDHP